MPLTGTKERSIRSLGGRAVDSSDLNVVGGRGVKRERDTQGLGHIRGVRLIFAEAVHRRSQVAADGIVVGGVGRVDVARNADAGTATRCQHNKQSTAENGTYGGTEEGLGC